MKALSLVCVPVIAAASIFLAATAFAQQPAPQPTQQPAPPAAAAPAVPVGPPKDDIGRYQMLPMPPRAGSQGPVAILLDTQYGRNWSLFVQPDGSTIWKRNLVQRFGNLPQGHIARPAPGSQ